MALASLLTLNGTELTHQPSKVELLGAEPDRTQMLNGGYQSSVPEKGRRVVITYGDRGFADDDAYAELATELGTPPSIVEVTIVDFAGNMHTFDCLFDQDLAISIGVGALAEQFTFTLYEAAMSAGVGS